MRDEALEALIEEYRSRFAKVLRQICMCKQEYEGRQELLKLLSIYDEVARCIRERRPCNLGFLEVRVARRFLSTQVVIALNGRELSVEEFNRLISTAKFFREWYDNDCSIDAYMQPMIGADHYDIIKEFLARNLRELQLVCDGAEPRVSLRDVPTYVASGISRAIEDVRSTMAGKA